MTEQSREAGRGDEMGDVDLAAMKAKYGRSTRYGSYSLWSHGEIEADINDLADEIDALRSQLAEVGGPGIDERLQELAAENVELGVNVASARSERDALRQHILDIDAHATPYGDIPDEPGWVGMYLLTAGALHRALGRIGHSAPKCQAEAERAELEAKLAEAEELLDKRDRIIAGYRADWARVEAVVEAAKTWRARLAGLGDDWMVVPSAIALAQAVDALSAADVSSQVGASAATSNETGPNVEATGRQACAACGQPIEWRDDIDWWVHVDAGNDTHMPPNQREIAEDGGENEAGLSFAVAGYGSYMATREIGRRIRESLIEQISVRPFVSSLIIDFTRVEAMTVAFTDELLGKFFAEWPHNLAPEAVVVIGLNEATHESVVTALRRRSIDCIQASDLKLRIVAPWEAVEHYAVSRAGQAGEEVAG